MRWLRKIQGDKSGWLICSQQLLLPEHFSQTAVQFALKVEEAMLYLNKNCLQIRATFWQERRARCAFDHCEGPLYSNTRAFDDITATFNGLYLSRGY